MPTGMVVAPGNNAVTVTWNTVAGATSYNIYRSTSQGQQGTKVGASSTLSYVDSTALNGVTYYYEVTAANAAGEGPVSAQSTGVTPVMPITVPAPPTGVNAVGGSGQVTVTWTAATGSTSYNIYRSTSHGSQGTKIGASATTSYTDTTVVNGTTYYYEVTAANAAGEGPVSAQSTGVTPVMPITVPAPPTGVNAVAGSGQVTVTWTAATGSTSYNIYRSTSQGSQGTKIGASATTSYTDTTVVNGTTYYYEVTAANAAGEGPPSTQSSGVNVGAGAAPASSWSSVNFGGGGYVTGLIFHPTSQNVLYARTDVGGAYRWNEATMSWAAITDGFGPDENNYHSVESIALDPNNDQLVYLAGGTYTSERQRPAVHL